MGSFFKYALGIFLLSVPDLLLSQQRYDYNAEVGFDSPVYRGEIADKYSFPFIGTVYAYSDEFEMGDLEFNGKMYYGLMMNLNCHRGELLVQIGATKDCIVLKNSIVGDFNIGERRYTALFGERGIKGLAPGYYQVLYEGKDMILKQIDRKIYDHTDFSSGNITKAFALKVKYWLLKDGEVRQIRRERDLQRVYKSFKKDIRSYMSLHSENDMDSNLVYLMSMVEGTH